MPNPSSLALLALLPLALPLVACGADQPGAAAPASSSSASTAAPKVEKLRVVNLGYFDVATLSATPPAIAGRVGNDALLGVELCARPLVLECLVDPRNRGPEKKTHVVVDATIAEAGVDHQVTGANLTPAGAACIEAALRRFTQASPALRARNADAGVKSHLEIEDVVGVGPAVVLGVNEASDIAGAVRLALPGWGDCFADWQSTPPRPLKAKLRAVRPANAKDAGPTVPLEATFEPTTDASAGKVAACLQSKLHALQVKTPAGAETSLPYPFSFVHSGIGEPLPGVTPDLQMVELDLQRSQRAAEAAIAIGERSQAWTVYGDLVTRFKAKAKPEVTVAELTEKCAALVATDDKLLAAAQKQLAVEATTHAFTADQKAKDPSWADAEAASAKSLAAAQKDVDSYTTNRKADEGSCPKVHY